MANTADYVGTWYFRGIATAPCSIQAVGEGRFNVTDHLGFTYPGHLEGDLLVVQPPAAPPWRGELSSDGDRIAWLDSGEQWLRYPQ